MAKTERTDGEYKEIASKVWKREEELKSLKAELAALDRKIQLELAPQVEKKSKEENKEATNNVKTDVTSKGLRIKYPCQQARIYWNLINALIILLKFDNIVFFFDF